MGKAARRRQLKELVTKERIDVIGVQEIIKKDFSERELKDLSSHGDFFWVWTAAIGHSRGILMGVRKDLLEIEGSDKGRFFLSVKLRHKRVNSDGKL